MRSPGVEGKEGGFRGEHMLNSGSVLCVQREHREYSALVPRRALSAACAPLPTYTYENSLRARGIHWVALASG